jgi:flavin-dependent dehydrogenase
MSENKLQYDIFIAGGGPAGLAAAIAARQKGFSVILADYARPPIDKACGEGLMPDAVLALNQLGIVFGFNQGTPFRGIRFTDGKTSVTGKFPHSLGWGIRRLKLHELLVRRAMEVGVSLLWGTRVSGLEAGRIQLNGQKVETCWVIAADGQNSQVRKWMGLDHFNFQNMRVGYTQHFRVTPWTDFVEVHWGTDCQIVVTPIGPDEICLALTSRKVHLRLSEALLQFPQIAERLKGASATTDERGAISSMRRMSSVYRHRFALVGDASGSVDAVTGKGLCLAFQQALFLAKALQENNLGNYQAAHRRATRLPLLMSQLMLSMDRYAWLRRKVLSTLTAEPQLFSRLLAAHVNAISPAAFGLSRALKTGWRVIASPN